ncbi:MAG: nucleotidyltransferase domain-containing protein [Candidatus Hodarchaeales archaeon]|jgi:hypothetical protein
MNSFQIAQRIHVLLKEFAKPWFVAGGWAIDLHLNYVTRPHEDVEIIILRQDQLVLQEFLADWDFQKVIPPAKRGLREPWKKVKEKKWVFRRDHRIVLPFSKIGLVSPLGIPYLCPEIVLLYKTKYRKKKDYFDFEKIVSHLDDEGRQWLRSAIEIHSPSHPWLERL